MALQCRQCRAQFPSVIGVFLVCRERFCHVPRVLEEDSTATHPPSHGVQLGRPIWVRGSANQPPGPPGALLGTPIYIPQNYPHDVLIILIIHKCGKKILEKIYPSAQAAISQGLAWRSGRG